jgi:hypothetical protein
MSFVSIPDPDGTRKNCKYGCGLMTVLADQGTGRLVRVHCGTFQPRCPGRNGVPAPHRAA